MAARGCWRRSLAAHPKRTALGNGCAGLGSLPPFCRTTTQNSWCSSIPSLIAPRRGLKLPADFLEWRAVLLFANPGEISCLEASGWLHRPECLLHLGNLELNAGAVGVIVTVLAEVNGEIECVSSRHRERAV